MQRSSRATPTKKLDLNDFLRSHPLAALGTFAVTVATLTASVMTYMNTETVKAINIQHQAETVELKTRSKADLLAATQPLKSNIEDLNQRISSIERRVPGAGPAYLDVSTISIGPEGRKALGGRYSSYDNDGFFVALPSQDTWKFQITNELERQKSMYSFFADMVNVAPQLKRLAEATVFLWQADTTTEIAASIGKERVKFTFQPSISVQPIDENLVSDRAKLIQDVMDDGKEVDKKDLATIASKLDAAKSASKKEASSSDAGIIERSADEVVKETKLKQEMIEFLDKLGGKSDLTNFILFDVVTRFAMQQAALPLQYKIISMQKKGNVLYVQSQIVFRGVEVSVNGGESKQYKTFAIDLEVFFVGTGRAGYLINLLLPPVPGRADDFSWMTSWLVGLRVPIE